MKVTSDNSRYVRGPSLIASAVACLLLLPNVAEAQGLPVDTGSHIPVALWAAGAAVLGLVLAYGIIRNRKQTNSEKQMTERATEKLYAKEAQEEERTAANVRQ
jgi:hypothetical protein